MKKFFTCLSFLLFTLAASAQTYNGGTWYSLYAESEITNVVIGSDIATWDVFAPASGTVTFDYKKLALLTVNGKVKVETSADGSNFTEIGSVSYSDYKNYKSGSVSGIPANIKKMKFVNTSTGSQTKNVKLPLAKHILLSGGDFGKSSVSKTFTQETRIGESTSIRADFRSFLTNGDISISLTEGDAEVFRLGSEDNTSGALTMSMNGNSYAVGANACASANGTATACYSGQLGKIDNYSFQIYFCPKVGGQATGKITITDGTSTATISLTGTGLKLETLEVPVDLSFCSGSSVEYHGKTYTQGVTADHIEAIGAVRDTTYIVNVNEKLPSYTAAEMQIYVGDDEVWNGIALKDSTVGVHTVIYTTENAVGCDSIVTLTLTVNKLETLTVPVELAFCEGGSDTYRGVEYKEAGVYNVPAEGATRDTVYVVNVTVNQPSYTAAEMQIYVGDNEEWNGIALKDSTVGVHTVVYTTENAVGCDSIVTLTLTVLALPTTYGEYNASMCPGDSVEFAGVWYYDAVQKDITLDEKNIYGGDSIVSLTVTVLPVDFVELNTDSLHVGDTLFLGDGLWYLVGDELELLTDTAYVMEEERLFDITMTATNEFGCDSVIVRHVVVEKKQEDTPATGLDNVEKAAEAVKELRNGVLYIRRNDALYTTEGRRVE